MIFYRTWKPHSTWKIEIQITTFGLYSLIFYLWILKFVRGTNFYVASFYFQIVCSEISLRQFLCFLTTVQTKFPILTSINFYIPGICEIFSLTYVHLRVRMEDWKIKITRASVSARLYQVASYRTFPGVERVWNTQITKRISTLLKKWMLS